MRKISTLLASLIFFTGIAFASPFQTAKQTPATASTAANTKTVKKPVKKDVKKVPHRTTTAKKPTTHTTKATNQ